MSGAIIPVGKRLVSSIAHGALSSITTTAAQIIATSTPTMHGVIVFTDDNNSGYVCVGNSNVTYNSADTTDSPPLPAGRSIEVPISDVSNLYVIASAAGQKIYWIAW